MRAADPQHPTRRDVQPAGLVLVIMLVALAAGAVLNSQALLDDARAKPLGASRTVSIVVWSPVARVSAVFGLDRPRRAAEEALGRIDDTPAVTVTVPPADTATTTLSPSGTPTPTAPPVTAAPTTVPPPPTLPAASAEDPLRTLLVGDSTMTAVGGALTRQLAATGVATSRLDARPATGFSRPDYFDWPTRLVQLTADEQPHLTIAMFGGNDAQGFEFEGEVHPFGSESWLRIYRARVATAMDLLGADGRLVVWIGQPAMRSSAFDAKMQTLNEIYRSEADARPGVTFLDARPVLAGPDGGYAEYRTATDGSRSRIRDGDGIHLSVAGAELLAAAALADVLADIGPAPAGGSAAGAGS
jgi:uncharacterized protein